MNHGPGVYLYLRSNDSLDFYPDNNVHSFTVKLPKRLYLHGKWVCAICEIYLPPFHSEESLTTPQAVAIDVCSTICGDTVIGNQHAPVIRRLVITGEERLSGTRQRFNPLQYTELIRHEASEIHIYLRHESQLQFPVGNVPLYCTLHLKKIA